MVHYSLGGVSIQQVHSHGMRTETITSLSPWIHSLNGWRPTPCPCYTGRELLSSCMMIWLHARASYITSTQMIVLSLQAALLGSAKG